MIHYLFKEDKEFIPVMKHLLKCVTDQDFEFNDEPKEFMGRYRISFGNKQVRSFVNVMDWLRHSTEEHVVYHFFPIKWIDKIETSIEEPKPQIICPQIRYEKNIDKMFEVNSSIPEKLINKYAIEALREQKPQLREDSITGRNWKKLKGRQDKFKVLSVPYRVYRVRYATNFGEYLLNASPAENIINEIPSIIYDRWASFIQIARSVLVNYHITFGNYERIKVCKQCKKLFFEKRGGRKLFCSDDCKWKSSRESEPTETYRCRNRENNWIRREIPNIKFQFDTFVFEIEIELKKGSLNKEFRKGLEEAFKNFPKKYNPAPEHVRKSQCEHCETYMNTGECDALMKNNKLPFRIQKVLSQPLRDKEGKIKLSIVKEVKRLIRSR